MTKRTVTVFLVIAVLLSFLALVPKLSALRLPGNHQGYAPVQPIQFSHRLHAGDMQIPCLYCHSSAEESRHAGVPAGNVCMNCHQFVKAPIEQVRLEEAAAAKEGRPAQNNLSPELKKLYEALGYAENGEKKTNAAHHGLEWIKVHNLPDFVYFDHSRHVNAGVACQDCHGAIQTMNRVRQDSTLSMGWCVNCHRAANADGVGGRPAHASLDCIGCHR